MSDEVFVSVMIATYNPTEKALAMTLRSIFAQKHCKYEIVVTDDGSIDDKFEFIEAFFKMFQFKDYTFVKNPENLGTVKNALNGLKNCTAKYVKPISPGDCLYGEETLATWLHSIETQGAVLSFSDTVYYEFGRDYEVVLKKVLASPYNLDSYVSGGEKLRKDYLLMDNKCIGASTLVKKNIFEKYLKIIENKVIYCEDAAYRLMLFDNEPISWFNNCSVLYQYGTGVSTCNDDAWRRKIRTDWVETNKILKEWLDLSNPFDRKLLSVIESYDGEEVKLKNKISFYSQNLDLALKRLLYKTGIKKWRMSPIEEKKEFIAKLRGCEKLC